MVCCFVDNHISYICPYFLYRRLCRNCCLSSLEMFGVGVGVSVSSLLVLVVTEVGEASEV